MSIARPDRGQPSNPRRGGTPLALPAFARAPFGSTLCAAAMTIALMVDLPMVALASPHPVAPSPGYRALIERRVLQPARRLRIVRPGDWPYAR